LWNNFQPDQLFPADTLLNFPNTSDHEQHPLIDPQLHQPHQPQAQMHSHTTSHPHQMPQYAPMGNATANQQHQHHQQRQTSTLLENVAQLDHQQQHQHQAHHYQTATHRNDPNSWAHVDMSQHQQQRPDDVWSNSTVSQGPIVPTTLNVEDWFNFFGLQGTTSGFSAFPQ